MTVNDYKKMIYSFEKPMWHNLTKPSTVPYTAEEVIDNRFDGGFEIDLRPVTVRLNRQDVETGHYAIIRGASKVDPKEVVLDICTERYHPLQPRQVAQIFDANVCQPAETMAFLGQGDDMFISWKMPTCDIREGDSVDMYGIVRTGFTTKSGTRLFIAGVRPVCWNTITMAEGWARTHTDKEANRGMIWRGKGTNWNLARDLGYWMEHVQTKAQIEVGLLQSFFGRLAQKPINSDKEAWDILYTAYPNRVDNSEFGPYQLKAEVSAKVADYNDGQRELREGIKGLFDGAGTAITPDAWGMLNSTTEWFCHYQPSKKPIVESVMFGNRAQKTLQMVNVLSDFAK